MLGLLALVGIALGLLIALLTAMLAWQMVHPPRRTAAWAIARGFPTDPSDLKLPFEEWWLERPGGARLPVWDITTRAFSHPHDDSLGRSVTAVFLHGWGHGRVNSLQRIASFVPLVARIVLYDLRGHGDSLGGSSTLGDGEDDDLLTLLEHLGEGPFLLVGHSMGAVIALRAASRAASASAIAGVIAYGPYCDFHQSLRGRLRVNGLPGRPISDLGLLAQRMRGVRPASVAPASLRDLAVPLLVIHGAEDQVAPIEHARRIVEAAPHSRLLEVQDAAHTDTHSVEQTRHDEAVRGFIGEVRSRTQAMQHAAPQAWRA